MSSYKSTAVNEIEQAKILRSVIRLLAIKYVIRRSYSLYHNAGHFLYDINHITTAHSFVSQIDDPWLLVKDKQISETVSHHVRIIVWCAYNGNVGKHFAPLSQMIDGATAIPKYVARPVR